MNRILEFLPAIIIIGLIVVAFRWAGEKYINPWFAYGVVKPYLVPWLVKKIISRDARIETVADTEGCINNLLVTILISPAVTFFGPLEEELLYRMPLILIFPEMSTPAWLAILAAGILFGMFHWLYPLAKLLDKSAGVGKRLANFFPSSILAIIIGYLGVKYQSIWLCIGIHIAWNSVLISGRILSLYLLAKDYQNCRNQ